MDTVMLDIDELRQRQQVALTMGIVIGALAGALVASLLAPRSGQQTRELVRERGLEWKDRVNDRLGRMRPADGSPL
jgi:gas vesicle protein